MDSGGVKGCNCNGTEPSVSVDSKEEGVDKGENEDMEANSPLRPAANGGLPGKALRRSKRKVQWNDHNGKKLVEVLEFQPRCGNPYLFFITPRRQCDASLSLLFSLPPESDAVRRFCGML